MTRLNFGWLTGKDVASEEVPNPARRAFFLGAAAFAAAGVGIAAATTEAQAWHKGHPHGPPHAKWKSQQYSHNKWKSQEYHDDYHSPKRSAYRRRKYYHHKYGSWHGHPQCMHLGPFGICEY